ncbi:MAG TPA: methyltransferase dimerization domain-containing protein, partial [Burkholderiaceae bacterium]|nr:methyltransferase dimerization domain-containing protein [Burkholderiaceae bacterium]
MNNLSAERLLRCGEDQWAATLLQAALELGVFTELGRGPRTCAQLQRRLALRGPGAADLLDALVGLGWLDREGDDPEAVYVNAREASHYLDARSPASLAGWLGDAFMIATLAAASLVCALRGEPWTPWPL